jgi:hypothetical protein
LPLQLLQGQPFLQACNRGGCRVFLLTLESLLGSGWARDHLDDVFAMPALTDRRAVINTVAYLMRTRASPIRRLSIG